MKRLAFAAVMLGLSAAPVWAAGFTINFCPGSGSCPANVSEARLTFNELTGTADPNDYDVFIRIVGSAGTAFSINQVSFTVDAADNVVGTNGYEALPTLTSAPGGPGAWNVFFDNVSNGGCTSNTHNSKEVCAHSTTNGPLVNGTNLWEFAVDFGSGISPLAIGSAVNLRAQFLTSAGKNAGILSPDGGPLGACTSTQPDCTSVPEPATFLMVAAGLASIVTRKRRAQI